MKYMLYKFVNNNPAFGRKRLLVNNIKKECFITNYIAVDKNIKLPNETEEEKEFFVCIHEYISENEDKDEDDDTMSTESSSRNTNSSGSQLRTRSENYDNNNETESNDELDSNETNSIDVNIILSSDNSSVLDSAIHPELIMDDINQIRDEREYEELINDTDSVS